MGFFLITNWNAPCLKGDTGYKLLLSGKKYLLRRGKCGKVRIACQNPGLCFRSHLLRLLPGIL